MLTKRYRALALVLCLGLICGTASADRLELLPVERIEARAFYDAIDTDVVVIDEGTLYIGSQAFGNDSFRMVIIPSTVQHIEDDAFDGCSDLSAFVRNNPYAQAWCIAHGIPIVEPLEFQSDYMTGDNLIVLPSDSTIGREYRLMIDSVENWSLKLDHLPGTDDWFTISANSGIGATQLTIKLTAVPGTYSKIMNRDNYATKLTLTTESGKELSTTLVIYKSGPFTNTHLNTGNWPQDLVAIAMTQIGYVGSNSANDEDGILNPGNKPNDFTKYCRFLGIPGNPWCASFVSWCAFQAGIPTSIITRKTYAMPDSMSPNVSNGRLKVHYFNNISSVQKQRSPYLQLYGIFENRQDSNPKCGDLIFFRSPTCVPQRAFEHIGIVVSSTADTVTYIDGNGQDRSDEVKLRTIPKTEPFFAGYFSPWLD